MNLKHLSDTTLRYDSKNAAFKEKEATTVLLHHIKEVDRRKLYCDWKYTSLFDWCVKELGLCEGSAHLRITAARTMKDIPEIEKKIEEGLLTLSSISQVNQFCRKNEIKGVSAKKKLLKQVENLSKKETEKKLFELTGKEKPAKETKITFVVSDETIEALNEVKALLGKDVSSDELMKLMVSALKEKVEKEKFKQVKRPQAARVAKGRGISAAVKREVYTRDKKCVKCGSKHRLNFDHRHPYSFGGDNTVENIRLLCFNCNQRAWMTSSG
jgi:hypothetical protein